jgi:outer membrane lipoprotein-sorting protein
MRIVRLVMRSWMHLRFLVCGFVVLVPMHAVAQSPSGVEIFARSEQAYRNFQSIRVDVEWKYVMEGGGSIPTMELMADRSTSWIEPDPGLVRIESKTTKDMTIVEATHLYEYRNKGKEFNKRPRSIDLDKFVNVKVWHYPEVFQMTEPVVAGSEKLKISGKQFDCWILEARALPGDPTGSAQLGAAPGPMRVWIDKDSNLPLKHEMRSVLGSQKVIALFSMKVTALQLNQPIPPDTFVFVPPKNSKEVSQFGGEKQ